MYSIETLNKTQRPKWELFQNDKSFDFALPQEWLNEFAAWCQVNGRKEVTYDLIRSTTVWSYVNDKFAGRPLFKCKEVYFAYKAYKSCKSYERN